MLNLLNEKLNETSIKSVFNITNQMTITPLKTTDFFIVIGNLLDNAIKNINLKNKKIIISTYQDDFEATIIIKNTYDLDKININATNKKII